MPVLPTYPGVYIEEISSGVRTIAGVATSVTAFIGRAKRGPVDQATQIFSFSDYERTFGGLWNKSTMSFAVRDFFMNGGGQAVIVRVHKNAVAAELSIGAMLSPPNPDLRLVAVNEGSWGNKLSVEMVPVKPGDTSTFNLTIKEQGGITEKFFNVTVDGSKPSDIARVLAQNSQLMRVKQDEPDASPPMSPVASPPGVLAKEGSDGEHITDQELFTAPGMAANKKGLYALENADLFNLLCLPPYQLIDNSKPGENEQPTDVSSELVAAANVYCKSRRAMLLVDSPSTWNTMDKAKTGFNDFPGFTSSNAALFFPRLKMANPEMDKQIEEFVSCGAVAGIFAKTDADRGVWKAPAGQDAKLIGVNQLSVPLTDQENGVLNQLGINCLRTFPVYGRLVWGSRTLEGADQLASEWKYISVRRTALFIEETLFRGTKWVVFEPNDESLWSQIRLNIGAFMHNLFRQGAFQGSTPKEAYLVKCDKETTTQNDINSGIVNILVGFAPLKPAEFVMIKIQQLAGQIEF